MYQALGVLKSTATGQTIIPTFPDLPDQQVGEFGGYFGAIAVNTHNLYEEFPTLGVTAEGLRASLGPAPAGPYASALALANTTANQNLLGFPSLLNRRPEAQNVFLMLSFHRHQIASNRFKSAFKSSNRVETAIKLQFESI